MSSYAWALGFNVADSALIDVQSELMPFNRTSSFQSPQIPAISSTPIDLYPVREIPLSGKERGDGTLSVQWQLGLTVNAYAHVLNTYWMSGVSTAMTIRTYMHETGNWQRANAYASRPVVSGDTFTFYAGRYIIATFVFNKLMFLP